MTANGQHHHQPAAEDVPWRLSRDEPERTVQIEAALAQLARTIERLEATVARLEGRVWMLAFIAGATGTTVSALFGG